ncbi:MAG TPA: hypothetical protein VGI39_28785 [Polyangiaceae bacterium]
MPASTLLGLFGATLAFVICACGGSHSTATSPDASAQPPTDASVDAWFPGSEAGQEDGGGDSAAEAGDCTYGDAGMELDPSTRFTGSCAGGCPAGTICAVEIGGVAGGGGEYCAPIVNRCAGNATCACLASCVCGSFSGRQEQCTDPSSDAASQRGLSCDNGVR